jgi:hypothetical protein
VSDETEQDFLEDFGSPRLSASAVEDLLARARAAGDVDLRRLAKEVQLWRWLAPQLLDRLAPVGSAPSHGDSLLKTARFLIRGEGAIGQP